MCALKLVNVNLQTKLEVPNFTRSKDMMGRQNLKMGHMTLTTPI